jgi:hypothetical protein
VADWVGDRARVGTTSPMTHVDAPRTRPTTRPWLPIVGAYFVSLLFFPLQMIAIGMLVCGGLVFMSVYVLWTQTHRIDPGRRARLDHQVPRVLLGVVALGIVAAFLWPPTTAVVAFGTSIALCAAWFAMERKIQARSDR